MKELNMLNKYMGAVLDVITSYRTVKVVKGVLTNAHDTLKSALDSLEEGGYDKHPHYQKVKEALMLELWFVDLVKERVFEYGSEYDHWKCGVYILDADDPEVYVVEPEDEIYSACEALGLL